MCLFPICYYYFQRCKKTLTVILKIYILLFCKKNSYFYAAYLYQSYHEELKILRKPTKIHGDNIHIGVTN